MRLAGFQNAAISNGTDTAHNSIKWFKNESGVTVDNVTVVWPGWYTNTDGGGPETNNNGNLTITASLEYPSGTRTQILFGGSATGTVVAGTLLQADKLTLAGGTKIPAGAWAAIHTYITCSAGTRWPLVPCANSFNGGKTENTESGLIAGVTDKTMSGAPAGTSPGYFPTAVLSLVSGAKKVCLAACGDSINTGAGDGNYDTSNNTSYIGRAATGQCPILHMGVSGTTAQFNAANFSKRIALMQLCGITHCTIEYASNDIAGGRSSAQVQADVGSMVSALNAVGIKAIVNTIMPKLTSVAAQNYYRQSTQTPNGGGFVAGTGSVRHAYNQAVRAGLAGAFDYMELSDAVDVDSANTLTVGGGYLLVGPSTRLDQPYNATISAGATTTVIPTNIIKATSYFASSSTGYVLFTSGTNNGTFAAISSSDNAGNITLSAALPSAPVNGDTCILYNARIACTADGTHPNFTDNSNSFGGHLVLRDVASPKLAAYLA